MRRMLLVLVCMALSGCAYVKERPPEPEWPFDRTEYAGMKISDLDELDNHMDDNDLAVVVDSTIPLVTKKIKTHNLFRYDVEHKTASYPVVVTDGGKVLTNSGSSGTISFTLPECIVDPSSSTEVGEGWWVVIYTVEPYQVNVRADPDDSIEDFWTVAEDDFIYSDAVVGSAVKVMCINGNNAYSQTDLYNFYTTGYVGVWTVDQD